MDDLSQQNSAERDIPCTSHKGADIKNNEVGSCGPQWTTRLLNAPLYLCPVNLRGTASVISGPYSWLFSCEALRDGFADG